jgi:hypothetical protein
MVQATGTSDIEAAARLLLERQLEERIGAIRELARVSQDRDRAREQLAALDREAASGYAASVAAGWTPAELRKLGYAAPAAAPRGRPRAAASGGPGSAPRDRPAAPAASPEAAGQGSSPGILAPADGSF